MKKRYLVGGVFALLILALAIPAAFAANTDITGPDNGWVDQMFNWHSEWVDQSVKNGQMSEEQAKAWKDHFQYMSDFHKENGFGMMNGMMGGMMGGPGANGNFSNGMMGNGTNSGFGMMGDYQQQTN